MVERDKTTLGDHLVAGQRVGFGRTVETHGWVKQRRLASNTNGPNSTRTPISSARCTPCPQPCRVRQQAPDPAVHPSEYAHARATLGNPEVLGTDLQQEASQRGFCLGLGRSTFASRRIVRRTACLCRSLRSRRRLGLRRRLALPARPATTTSAAMVRSPGAVASACTKSRSISTCMPTGRLYWGTVELKNWCCLNPNDAATCTCVVADDRVLQQGS